MLSYIMCLYDAKVGHASGWTSRFCHIMCTLGIPRRSQKPRHISACSQVLTWFCKYGFSFLRQERLDGARVGRAGTARNSGVQRAYPNRSLTSSSSRGCSPAPRASLLRIAAAVTGLSLHSRIAAAVLYMLWAMLFRSSAVELGARRQASTDFSWGCLLLRRPPKGPEKGNAWFLF